MAEISKFFNSTVTDERWYQAQDFAEYFWMFLTSGLIHVDREPFINVEVVEDSLQLKVTPGPALIKGHLYWNTKDLYLTVDTPDVLEDRFDRLVLQLDLVPEDGKAGRIKALIKKGVASNDPVIPELTRNERIFELSLGYFRVRKNTASIAQLDYVDERLHEDYCGIVNSLITAPTQAMQQQFDLWFNSIKAGVEGDVNEWVEQQQKGFIEWTEGSKEDFDDWFESIKGSLEGDVATNLTLRVDKVEKDLSTHKEVEATLTRNGHVQLSNSTNSTSDTMAATPSAVKKAMDKANEAFTSASNGKKLVGEAITGVDPDVTIPTEPSFAELATAIGQISTGKKWASGSIKDKHAPSWDSDFSYSTIPLDFKPSVIVVHTPSETKTPPGYADNVSFTGIRMELDEIPVSFESIKNGNLGYNSIYFDVRYIKNSNSFQIGAKYSGGGSFLTYSTISWVAYE